jgi:hypothetical protein
MSEKLFPPALARHENPTRRPFTKWNWGVLSVDPTSNSIHLIR